MSMPVLLSEGNARSMILGSDASRIWRELFSVDNVKLVFYSHIFPKGGVGVDRVSVFKFKDRIETEAEIISRKCIQGTYKFSPYLELLQSKGRGKAPRVISIPTVRDRIVLKIITSFLHDVFKENLARDLPNTVIKKIIRQISLLNSDGFYIKLDLKNFYGSVCHDSLMKEISSRANFSPFIRLLSLALKNPTLPSGYSRERRCSDVNERGIPQGLSISNILAEIYIQSLDDQISPLSTAYFRFVDDVFILCTKDQVPVLWSCIDTVSKQLQVEVSLEKSTSKGAAQTISEGFEFLGYKFQGDTVSVKEASYQRFLHSIVGKITHYRHSYRKNDQLDIALAKKVFIEDLNERITGAISENKRYGWVFFFSEINAVEQLHKLDMVIARVASRLPDFSLSDLSKIKKVSRAHYEANYSPKRGYIHNYNLYSTMKQKHQYLNDRGHLKPDVQYDEQAIEQIFSRVRASNLLKLEKDLANLS